MQRELRDEADEGMASVVLPEGSNQRQFFLSCAIHLSDRSPRGSRESGREVYSHYGIVLN